MYPTTVRRALKLLIVCLTELYTPCTDLGTDLGIRVWYVRHHAVARTSLMQINLKSKTKLGAHRSQVHKESVQWQRTRVRFKREQISFFFFFFETVKKSNFNFEKPGSLYCVDNKVSCHASERQGWKSGMAEMGLTPSPQYFCFCPNPIAIVYNSVCDRLRSCSCWIFCPHFSLLNFKLQIKYPINNSKHSLVSTLNIK